MITVEDVESGIRVLTIDRPEKKNALDRVTYQSLAAELRSADADASVRAIVLAGAGGTFCSGNDIADFSTPDKDRLIGPEDFLTTLVDIRKPVIAAVEGWAVGIGTTLLLHCDLVYAGEGARFRMPFVALGVVPEAGSTYLFERLAGHRRSTELLLLGDTFGASVAESLGLVNAVVAEGSALEFAVDRARAVAALPAESVVATKALLAQATRREVHAAMQREFAEFARLLDTPETRAILKTRLNP